MIGTRVDRSFCSAKMDVNFNDTIVSQPESCLRNWVNAADTWGGGCFRFVEISMSGRCNCWYVRNNEEKIEFLLCCHWGLGNEKWRCVDFCHWLGVAWESIYFLPELYVNKTVKISTFSVEGTLIKQVCFKYYDCNNAPHWITKTFTLSAIKIFFW